MRLSLYTDFALRALIYLGANRDGKPVSAAQIAARYHVSRHHMHKVAQGLRRLGYVRSISGRYGGLQLALAPERLNIGEVVEAMEGSGRLVDCRRDPCPLHGGCLLKGALDRAERQFMDELKKYTVADVLRGPTLLRLERLIKAA